MELINTIHQFAGVWFFVLQPVWLIVVLLVINRLRGIVIPTKSRFLLFYTTSLFASYNLSWEHGANLQTGHSELSFILVFSILFLAPILTLFMNYVYGSSLKRISLT